MSINIYCYLRVCLTVGMTVCYYYSFDMMSISLKFVLMQKLISHCSLADALALS